MTDEEAEMDTQALPVQAEPALSEKLATALKPVAESRGEQNALTIAAPKVGSVLPLKFYEGASQLVLADSEREMLAEAETCADDDIEIRPDGLIYASHMFYRRALTRIFGAGQWALIPGSDAKPDPQTNHVYRTWVLVVRGCYIGDAVGWAQYFPNNPRANWADSLETTRSDAISKICAKTLGIGANPWDKRFAREWRKKYAIQVWVNVRGQKEKRWRRIDDDLLEGEEKSAHKPEISPATAQTTAPNPTPAPAVHPSAEPAKNGKPPAPAQVLEGQPKLAGPRKLPAKSPAHPAVTPPEAPEPHQTTEQMVAENNIRLFMAEARRRKLIVGNDAAKAIEFLVDKMSLPFEREKFSGKTQIEIIRHLLLAQTWRRFTDGILPQLREIQI